MVELLTEAAVGAEGLHVDSIARRLGVATAEVRAIVTRLENDGVLFATVDDDHFAA